AGRASRSRGGPPRSRDGGRTRRDDARRLPARRGAADRPRTHRQQARLTAPRSTALPAVLSCPVALPRRRANARRRTKAGCYDSLHMPSRRIATLRRACLRVAPLALAFTWLAAVEPAAQQRPLNLRWIAVPGTQPAGS